MDGGVLFSSLKGTVVGAEATDFEAAVLLLSSEGGAWWVGLRRGHKP